MKRFMKNFMVSAFLLMALTIDVPAFEPGMACEEMPKVLINDGIVSEPAIDGGTAAVISRITAWPQVTDNTRTVINDNYKYVSRTASCDGCYGDNVDVSNSAFIYNDDDEPAFANLDYRLSLYRI